MDDVTQEMVDAFHTAWADTHPGLPGDRTRAGLDAALDVYMTDRNSELARQHEGDDAVGAALLGAAQFAESFDKEGDLLHLCRDVDGNVLLYATAFGVTSEVAVMDESVVRWLSGVLIAALEDWPQQG